MGLVNEIARNWSDKHTIVTSLNAEEVLDAVLLSLHNTIRFNGAVSFKYDVLMHSWITGRLAADLAILDGTTQHFQDTCQYFGLIHDFGEAVVGDVVYPLKNNSFKESYEPYLELEQEFVKFCSRCVFGIEWSTEALEYVQQADSTIGLLECIGVSTMDDFYSSSYMMPIFKSLKDADVGSIDKFKSHLNSIALKVKNEQ